MLVTALSLFLALPLTLAAPTCSLRPSTTASAPSSTPTATNPGNGTHGNIAMAWFADWHPNVGVSNINWTGYTHMAFFTAQPAADATLEVIVSDPSMVDQFTTAAKSHSVKPLLTIGGWSGSLYWSTSVATADNRTKFANSVVEYAFAHGFSGLDFDWEYPGQTGIGCNTHSTQDSANFLSFIQQVHQLAPNLTLSAATSIKPWYGPDGTPMTDVSAFASTLDWIEVMNYDIFGTFSSVTGPNSPLNDTCAASGSQQGSAVSAVAAWTKAGFPVNKIVLGVAAYGHSFTVTQSTAVASNNLNIYTSFDKQNIPAGDSWDPVVTSTDECGNPPVGNGNSGIFNFWSLIQNGFLNQDGTASSKVVSLFDECSQTPFIYNAADSTLISYDDPKSFAAKGQYIKATGLGGYAMYESGGDYQGMLVSSINKAMA